MPIMLRLDRKVSELDDDGSGPGLCFDLEVLLPNRNSRGITRVSRAACFRTNDVRTIRVLWFPDRVAEGIVRLSKSAEKHKCGNELSGAGVATSRLTMNRMGPELGFRILEVSSNGCTTFPDSIRGLGAAVRS